MGSNHENMIQILILNSGAYLEAALRLPPPPWKVKKCLYYFLI